MNSKYTWIVLVVLVVLIGGFYLMKGQSVYQPQTDMTSPTQVNKPEIVSPSVGNTNNGQMKEITASVEYTENGFNPKNITVKAGTKVIWINKDSDEMWVASAPHPQHTDLPGFDALKGYKTGEAYSYTFTKVGNWKYHNHLSPSNFGVVIVEQ